MFEDNEYTGNIFKMTLWDWVQWLVFIWLGITLISCLSGCTQQAEASHGCKRSLCVGQFNSLSGNVNNSRYIARESRQPDSERGRASLPGQRSETLTEASYYTVNSCKREGTSGIMANGERLNDNEFTCASWDYVFGTRLRITGPDNKSVICTVTDRGPNRKLYKKGRKIDLSKAAFEAICPLRNGICKVMVEKI